MAGVRQGSGCPSNSWRRNSHSRMKWSGKVENCRSSLAIPSGQWVMCRRETKRVHENWPAV